MDELLRVAYLEKETAEYPNGRSRWGYVCKRDGVLIARYHDPKESDTFRQALGSSQIYVYLPDSFLAEVQIAALQLLPAFATRADFNDHHAIQQQHQEEFEDA